jgi:hypothetical protein
MSTQTMSSQGNFHPLGEDGRLAYWPPRCSIGAWAGVSATAGRQAESKSAV